MLSYPLTQYMFCSPGEGGVALVLSRAEKAAGVHQRARCILRSAVLRSRPFGSFEVFSPWLAAERGDSPSVAAAKGAFEMAGIGPDEIDVVQVQDTESGAEVMHLAECGFVDRRRAGGADPAGRHRDRWPAAGQHRRRLPRQRRADRGVRSAAGLRVRRSSCAAMPAPARCPTTRRPPSPTSTARPASPPAPCSPADGLDARHHTGG